MKKTFLFLLLIGLLTSCGSTKIERQAQRTFKGDWTLTNIELPSALVDVTLFDDADSRCFENSDWHFVSNNNTGSYMLNDQNCTSGEREFNWNVQEKTNEGHFYFSLKPEVDGSNARKVRKGYRLKLVSLDENQMLWEETVSYQGKLFTIRMSFIKK